MASTDDQSSSDWGASAWIEAARRGDVDALGKALEPFRAYLTRAARRVIGPTLATKLEAADMVQETFLAAQRGAAGFQGSTEAEWRAWLKAILFNLIANARRAQLDTRKRRAEPTASRAAAAQALDRLHDEITPPSRQLHRQERDEAIERALKGLPDQYRMVIHWHFDDGWTFELIGNRLGITADAARKLWVRALLHLKRALGPDHDPRRR